MFAPIINLLDDHIGWSRTLMVFGGMVLFCIPAGLLLKSLNEDKVNVSPASGEATAEWDDAEQHEINYFGCMVTTMSATTMGRRYIHLLHDAQFLLYLMSILLINIGFAAPYSKLAKQEQVPIFHLHFLRETYL